MDILPAGEAARSSILRHPELDSGSKDSDALQKPHIKPGDERLSGIIHGQQEGILAVRSLLRKPMSRRQFLLTGAALLAGLFGLKFLFKSRLDKSWQAQANNSYGVRRYGGID